MTQYEQELADLKTHDEVQGTEVCRYSGLPFIYTAGHGYLVVPKTRNSYNVAVKLCNYGYKGKLACYLEEDCEAPEYLKALGLI